MVQCRAVISCDVWIAPTRRVKQGSQNLTRQVKQTKMLLKNYLFNNKGKISSNIVS